MQGIFDGPLWPGRIPQQEQGSGGQEGQQQVAAQHQVAAEVQHEQQNNRAPLYEEDDIQYY